jgi:Glyoxalase-like domain
VNGDRKKQGPGARRRFAERGNLRVVPRSELDHLVVTAPDLASGAELVRRILGVGIQPGGEHPRIGTHNLLLKLGPSVYLEAIAPNPVAPDPGRPRWFELDRTTSPRLATWAARTSDIRATAAACSEPPGEVEEMTRGDLKWLITVQRDGGLRLGGAAPALIEWPAGVHPAARLADSGCSLVLVEAFHPDPAKVSAMLASISFEGPLTVMPLPPGSDPYLVATIDTPTGTKRLGGAAD